MKRSDAIRSMQNHNWYCRLYKKLVKNKGEALQFSIKWCDDNEHLSTGEFEFKANRLWLDDVNKPKWSVDVWEAITVANGMARRKENR